MRTIGSRRRSADRASRARVSSFSRSSRVVRAATHSSAETISGRLIVGSFVRGSGPSSLQTAPARQNHRVPFDVPTPHGPARVHLDPVEAPRAVLVLGHGAGG